MRGPAVTAADFRRTAARRSARPLTTACWTHRRAWGEGFRLAVCAADRCVVVTTADASSLRDAQHTVMELRPLPHRRPAPGGEPGAQKAAAPACTPPLTTPSTRRACPSSAWSRRMTPCPLALNRGRALLLASATARRPAAYRNIANRHAGRQSRRCCGSNKTSRKEIYCP